MLLKPLLGIAFLTFISSCATNNDSRINKPSKVIRLQIADAHFFSPRPKIISVDKIYQLSEQQHSEFRHYFNSKSNQKSKPHRRVFNYLKNYTQKYQFKDRTLTAKETLDTFQGNCLSLAILTTALAKSVAIETGYQIVDSLPVYQQEGDIILASEHIQSLLFDPQVEKADENNSVKGIIVDYFPSKGDRVKRRVTESEFSALYYRNLAADAIVNKDYNLAYWLLIETFRYNPADEHAVNMMALVHEKKGFRKNAESIYKQGIKYANHKLDLLRNYSLFLKKDRRFREAKQVERQLAKIKVDNPFDWIKLGHTAYTQRQYKESRRYFQKAANMAPYIHQAYLGIAKSEYKLGNYRAARRVLALAIRNTDDDETKNYYQAKLNGLKNR